MQRMTAVLGKVLTIGAMAAIACAHSASRQEQIELAKSLTDLGAYEQALATTRSLIAETTRENTSERAALHLGAGSLLLHLRRPGEALDETRQARALDPTAEPTDDWLRTLMLVNDKALPGASRALARAVATRQVDVFEFATAKWLAPLRALPSYRTIVASLVLNAGGLADEDLQRLNAAGGVRLAQLQHVIASPDESLGVCSLAAVQVREPVAPASGLTRIVAELVAPRIEATGVEFQKETFTTTVATSYSGVSHTSYSGGGVFWGSSLRSSFGFAQSTIRAERNAPHSSYSVVLNPQDLFALYQYAGVDQALLQNRVAVVFACEREVGTLPRARLQQTRVPVMDVVAYVAFDTDGLPLRRSSSEPVLAQ